MLSPADDKEFHAPSRSFHVERSQPLRATRTALCRGGHSQAPAQASSREPADPGALVSAAGPSGCRTRRPRPLDRSRPALLLGLARMSEQRDAAHLDASHRDLVYQVAAFQSVCGDAFVRQEYIAGASYALCTALDEAAALSSTSATDRLTGRGLPVQPQLGVQFHGDGRGGHNVFLFMANLLKNPTHHIDLLELLLIVIALGFEGMYREAINGKRALDEIRHAVLEAVRTCRGDTVPVAHWSLIERLLWARVKPSELANTKEELLS